MLKKIFSLFFVALLVGCASAPELEKYPRTQIDRPYTLPDGVATWETLLPTWYEKDNTSSYFFPPVVPVPLYWQSSLSDNLTLNWAPLPSSVSHQWFDSGAHLLGATYGLDALGYATDLGWIITGKVSVLYRRRLAKSWALQTEPSVKATYLTKISPWRWAAGLAVGPLWQATETLALTAKAAVRVQENFWDYTLSGVLSVKQSTVTRVTFPCRSRWTGVSIVNGIWA